jgi:hypothetical protein
MKPRTFANLVRLSFRPPAASSASANKSRYECRRHLAGNCHTERDASSQIMLHVYGPHIFHTDDEEVWIYVNRYLEFKPYVNRVKAITQGRVFTLPINLLNRTTALFVIASPVVPASPATFLTIPCTWSMRIQCASSTWRVPEPKNNHLRGPARNLSLPGHGRDDPARARRGARVFKARRRLTKSRELGARLLPMWFCVYV